MALFFSREEEEEEQEEQKLWWAVVVVTMSGGGANDKKRKDHERLTTDKEYEQSYRMQSTSAGLVSKICTHVNYSAEPGKAVKTQKAGCPLYQIQNSENVLDNFLATFFVEDGQARLVGTGGVSM